MVFLWWALIAVSVVLYIVIVTLVLPRVFYRGDYELAFSNDRGVRNYSEPNGRSIVYEPRREYREYIKQYILSKRGESTVIRCKLNQFFTFIDYDIVVFGGKNRVLKVINASQSFADSQGKEDAEASLYTDEIALPDKTTHVALVVNEIDDYRLPDLHIRKQRLTKKAVFFAITICALALLEILLLKYFFAQLFADVYFYEYLRSRSGFVVALLCWLAVSTINLAIFSVHFSLRKEGR